MADHDDWTADDDAQLRAALGSLRADVEAAPMPDVRFVKARGMARRRQRLLSWTAVAAAAAVVVGTVGYSQLGREAAGPLVPATRSGTTSAAPSPTTSVTGPGIVSAEQWQQFAGLAALPVVQKQPAWEGTICGGPERGTRTAERVVTDPQNPDSTLVGIQTRWDLPTEADAEQFRVVLNDSLMKCPVPIGMRDIYAAASRVSPLPSPVFRYDADSETGLIAIAQYGKSVAWVELTVPARTGSQPRTTIIDNLYLAALSRMGAPASATTRPTGGSSTATSGSGKAIDEDMPVTGPAPVPSSDLFVAASQWTAPLFGGGATASAGAGDSADSMGDIGVFCETDDFLGGFGGQLGEVEVRSGSGDANVIGHQRVRVDQSADPKQAKVAVSAQLAEEKALLAKGCTEPDGKVTASKGPNDGTYLLTKQVTGEATGTDYRWVGVAPLSTPGAWTTIVFHGTGDGQGFQGTAAEGFAELDRLLALAAQK